MNCTCSYLKVGGQRTDQRNWSPECVEHGLDSAWWRSPQQVAKRDQQNARIRDLRAQARAARQRLAEGSDGS